MGNWSFAQQEARKAVVASLNQRIAEKDALFPRLERPCGTPGAVYTITVEGNDLGCTVHLPFGIEDAIPASAKVEMKAALHDALLPIVERFYRRVWTETIAGKKLSDDPKPMPKRWELLFAKWLERCFQRGEMPTVEGRIISNEYCLPEAYKWWL
jgi:hypothetical protein